MAHDERSPRLEFEDIESRAANADRRLFWYPIISRSPWLVSWAIALLCAAIVWDFVAHGDGFRSLLAATGWGPVVRKFILAGGWAVAIVSVCFAIVVIDFALAICRHTSRNYDRRLAHSLNAIVILIALTAIAVGALGCIWVFGSLNDLLTHSFPPDPVAPIQIRAPTYAEIVIFTCVCGLGIIWLARIGPIEWSRWSRALRLVGVKRVAQGVILMSRLRLREPRADFFLHAPLVCAAFPLALCVTLFEYMPQYGFRWLVFILLVLYIILYSISLLRTPVWLFLGTSLLESMTEFYVLRTKWLWSHRIDGITLLDRSGTEGRAFYYLMRDYLIKQGDNSAYLMNRPDIARSWSVRTRPGLWEYSVLQLIYFVPVIVFDARSKSELVQRELEWLNELKSFGKVWILCNDDGSAPMLTHWITPELSDEVAHRLRGRLITSERLCAMSLSTLMTQGQ